MRTIEKKVVDLTPEEYRYCYRANLGFDGTMQEDIADYRRRRDIDAKVIMLWDDNAAGANRLIGWCLLHKSGFVTRGINTSFYVKRKHRRKGYGTLLMREVKRTHKRPFVHPWNKDNGKFFSHFNVYTYPDYRLNFMDKRKRVC